MIPSITGDTIAAISTPPGPGGIGIIRISGPQSLPVLKKLFLGRNGYRDRFASHNMYHGWIENPLTCSPVDEVLAVFMEAPYTYTREDVVEIHCHGSYLVLQEILGLILDLGIRLAAPGEFTKRAFLNGRIDLTQAEAVIEVLEAKTREGLQMAVAQLHGQLHSCLAGIRDVLLGVLAILEVAIDFPEDDVEIVDHQEIRQRLTAEVQAPLAALISSADKGKVYRDGIAVVILGRPNVGKSSLLNRLLREERAIVTAVPGTTRDTIEEYININGMPVRIIDTAGIREAVESVEEMGIQRARQKIEEADLILFLVDAAQPPDDDDRHLFTSISDRPHLLVFNKIDIADEEGINACREFFIGSNQVAISTKTGQGIDQLEDTIFNLVTNGSRQWDPGHACVPNVRHRESLLKAQEAILMAIRGLDEHNTPDLLAIELQASLAHLGDIVGESTPEDVLDVIFERFCIGK